MKWRPLLWLGIPVLWSRIYNLWLLFLKIIRSGSSSWSLKILPLCWCKGTKFIVRSRKPHFIFIDLFSWLPFFSKCIITYVLCTYLEKILYYFRSDYSPKYGFICILTCWFLRNKFVNCYCYSFHRVSLSLARGGMWATMQLLFRRNFSTTL